jgi:hypothetical protein
MPSPLLLHNDFISAKDAPGITTEDSTFVHREVPQRKQIQYMVFRRSQYQDFLRFARYAHYFDQYTLSL